MRTMRSAALVLLVVAGVAACGEMPTAVLSGPMDAVASAQPFLPGEQQPAVDLSRNPLAIHPVGAGQILAQTFTPSWNQWLGYIEVPVACSDGVLLNVKIREGIGGPILAEVNVIGLTGTVDGVFDLIQVYDPAVTKQGIRLKKRTEYALELAAFPAPGAMETTCGIASGPTGSSYARGRGWYQDPINGPAFLPLPNGNPTDDEDLPFRTLVR